MAVRFEVDACIPLSSANKGRSVRNIDDLADSLAGITIASSSQSTSTSPGTSKCNGLTIRESLPSTSYTVPHSSLVELTTRAERRVAEFDWNDAYPQLFFSQTPHHFLGVHNRGRFTAVDKQKLASPKMRDVERTIQPSLQKLRAALDVIKAVVVKHGQRGRLTLVCRDGELQVFERISQASCLPEDVMARFES